MYALYGFVKTGEMHYNQAMSYFSMFKPRKKQKSSLWDDDDDWNREETEEEEDE